MKSKVLILTISLLVIACGSVFGQAMTVESITGWTGSSQTIPKVDTWVDGDVITVRFHLLNPLVDPLVMISNGFVFKSEDGATWTGVTGVMNTDPYNWDLDDGYPCFFDLGMYDNYFSNDGMLSDTVGFGGAKGQFGTGLTPGFDDWCWELTIGPMAGQAGSVILDSSFFRPAGFWMWGLSGGTTIYPTWDGPHALYGYDNPGGAVGSGVDELPTSFALRQNYPNPFNPDTDILFELPTRAHVRLDIFNILGQRVRTLVDETRNAGYHTVQWDGTDHSGSSVSSGVYFYKIQADNFIESKKMMMLK